MGQGSAARQARRQQTATVGSASPTLQRCTHLVRACEVIGGLPLCVPAPHVRLQGVTRSSWGTACWPCNSRRTRAAVHSSSAALEGAGNLATALSPSLSPFLAVPPTWYGRSITEPEWQASMMACSLTPCTAVQQAARGAMGGISTCARASGGQGNAATKEPSMLAKKQAARISGQQQPQRTHRGQRVDQHAVQVVIHNLPRLQPVGAGCWSKQGQQASMREGRQAGPGARRASRPGVECAQGRATHHFEVHRAPAAGRGGSQVSTGGRPPARGATCKPQALRGTAAMCLQSLKPHSQGLVHAVRLLPGVVPLLRAVACTRGRRRPGLAQHMQHSLPCGAAAVAPMGLLKVHGQT